MSRPLLREAPPPEVVIHQSERFDRILSTLQAHGFRTNQALARDLNVSEMTVRRDLTELSELGQVKRLRGGVRLLGRPGGLALAANDQHELVERLIAESAADLVEDGQTIYIDAGPIAQFLARALRQRELSHLHVTTNSVAVALCLAGAATAHVIQLGGEVRASGAVVGQQAIRLLEAMSFDRCFLGAEGFSVDFGISDKHMPEIELKRAAIQHARWTGLTIASNRWTKQSMLRIVNLRDVQCVITDGALDESARAVLAERGLDLVTAEGAP